MKLFLTLLILVGAFSAAAKSHFDQNLKGSRSYAPVKKMCACFCKTGDVNLYTSKELDDSFYTFNEIESQLECEQIDNEKLYCQGFGELGVLQIGIIRSCDMSAILKPKPDPPGT